MQWEYLFVTFQNHKIFGEQWLRDRVVERGHEGWELAAITPDGEWIFKRPITAPEPQQDATARVGPRPLKSSVTD